MPAFSTELPLLVVLWFLAAVIFAMFAVWGRHIGQVMSWGRLSGDEGRFKALRIISALCAIGAAARAVTEAIHHV
jgi:hypothetical protein